MQDGGFGPEAQQSAVSHQSLTSVVSRSFKLADLSKVPSLIDCLEKLTAFIEIYRKKTLNSSKQRIR